MHPAELLDSGEVLVTVGTVVICNTDTSSATSIRWFEWLTPLVLSRAAFYWAAYLRECYLDDYVRVLKGKVIDHFSEVSGRVGSMLQISTDYCITVEGNTPAGVTKKYTFCIDREDWITVNIGEEIDYE